MENVAAAGTALSVRLYTFNINSASYKAVGVFEAVFHDHAINIRRATQSAWIRIEHEDFMKRIKDGDMLCEALYSTYVQKKLT